ncbi:MAG TPA: NAD(P)H-dependent oxidoreductase [Ilumatobacteraceae bacterium]
MQVVLVVAHPDPESFTHAIAATAIAGLQRAGHDVSLLDLYDEEFRPAMSLDERLAYHGDRPILDPMVERHARIVQEADALVFVYPTWWSTMPAILKGWLERVMVPGVGFVFDDKQRVRPGLTNVRRLVGISTYGAPRWYVAAMHDNGRRTLMRALRLNMGRLTRRTWLGLYDIDNSTTEARTEFLGKVDERMRSL